MSLVVDYDKQFGEEIRLWKAWRWGWTNGRVIDFGGISNMGHSRNNFAVCNIAVIIVRK